jgi:hypothetical protein
MLDGLGDRGRPVADQPGDALDRHSHRTVRIRSCAVVPRYPLLASQPGRVHDLTEITPHVARFERLAGTGDEHQTRTVAHRRMRAGSCLPQDLERVGGPLRKRQPGVISWSWCHLLPGRIAPARHSTVSAGPLPTGRSRPRRASRERAFPRCALAFIGGLLGCPVGRIGHHAILPVGFCRRGQ